MDIHKPKPWHGVREFLKEYLIIVVGVLTALAFEQTVEWLHVRADVGDARAALHGEMADDLRTLMLQAREDGCWPGRIGAYEQWAKGAGLKPPHGPSALMEGLSAAAWETAKTSAVPHMDLEERLALARFYSGIENQGTHISTIRQLSNELIGYLNRDSLEPQETHDLLRLAGRLRSFINAERRNVPQLLDAGRALGVKPGPPQADLEARVDRLCATYPPQAQDEKR
jgi:hypothetical protein